MAKTSRPTVKTLTLIKSRDIVVDRLLNPCKEDNHSECTGWAVLRKEVSPIDVNYFLKCTCSCHHQKKERKRVKKHRRLIRKKQIKKKIKRRPKLVKSSKKAKRSKRARHR